MYAQSLQSHNIEAIKENAYRARMEIDTELKVHPDYLEWNLKHLDDCMKNPTRGLIARREMKTVEAHAPQYYRDNLNLYLTLPAVKEKIEKFNKYFYSENMYHKTGDARKKLIQYKRIVFGNVKKSSKIMHYIIKAELCLKNYIKKKGLIAPSHLK